MLNRNLVPLNRNNSLQKLLTKMGSRSEAILLGNPCNLQMIFMNKVATLNAVKPVGKAPRCTPLEYLSTTTSITVKPWDSGKCVMKSIDRSSHTFADAGKGCSKPEGRLWMFLFCWHVTHSLMKRFTSLFKLDQKKMDSIRCVVLATPKWPPSGVAWCSSNRLGIEGLSLFSQILPLNKIKPL